MEAHDSKNVHFTRHYKQLELGDRADWAAARTNYRRLVHLWHPDRFALRPRERVHAQQQFIKLTKSYNVLRNFYRKNQRMPFELANSTPEGMTSSKSRDKLDTTFAQDTSGINASVLRREPSQRGQSMHRARSVERIAWVLAGACIIAGTVIIFLVLDRKASKAVAERGREVVKEAPQSDFLPSASEIRKSQSRGAFVKPTR